MNDLDNDGLSITEREQRKENTVQKKREDALKVVKRNELYAPPVPDEVAAHVGSTIYLQSLRYACVYVHVCACVFVCVCVYVCVCVCVCRCN